MFTLPQGCSAKREIILIERAFVYNFYLRTIVKLVLLAVAAENNEKPNELSLRTKAPPNCMKLEGRRRC